MRPLAGIGGVAFLNAAGRPPRLPNIGHAGTPAMTAFATPPAGVRDGSLRVTQEATESGNAKAVSAALHFQFGKLARDLPGRNYRAALLAIVGTLP